MPTIMHLRNAAPFTHLTTCGRKVTPNNVLGLLSFERHPLSERCRTCAQRKRLAAPEVSRPRTSESEPVVIEVRGDEMGKRDEARRRNTTQAGARLYEQACELIAADYQGPFGPFEDAATVQLVAKLFAVPPSEVVREVKKHRAMNAAAHGQQRKS